MSIEVTGLNKNFGDFVALDDVNVTIPTGQLTALLGPAAYAELARLCAERRDLLPQHPATAAAGRPLLPGGAEPASPA